METPKVEPLSVLKWGAVGLGLYAVGRFLGVVPEPGPDPLVDPDVVTEELDAPTFSRQYARVLADRIFAALYGSGTIWTGSTTEDEQAVIDALLEVRTNGDAALIVDAYGVRSGSWSLTGDLNLPAAIREYLSASDIETVNADYRQRNIEWQW